MKRLVLVDGNALLHRAYHATPPLTSPSGELVNAVYGFSLMLLKAWDELVPDFMAIAWDEKGPTFRHQAYTQYKATRGPSDDGLSSQYTQVFEVTKAFNIPEFRLSGYEADDLIGTLATQAAKKDKNLEIIILTGDRDIMQLIGERIKVLMPKKTLQDVGLYGIQEFIERFGFSPLQLIEYKALAGDASDNIPGVQGIGDVTATKLVKQFGSIEKIYQPSSLKTLPERTQQLLSEGAESAVLSKQLATIDTNAPIVLDLAECRVHNYDKSEVLKVFQELGFKSLINRLNNQTEKNGHAKSVQNDKLTETDGVVQNQRQNQDTIDLDLAVEKVLQKMSKNGVLIDLPFLEKLGTDLKDKLKNLEQGIYEAIGHEFNINSPKQLAEILFDELSLEVVRKTKTGRSTDEATLTELRDAHPAIPLILQYRQLFKLVSTYIDALPRYIGEDGRVHSTFNVEGAATGRLSCVLLSSDILTKQGWKKYSELEIGELVLGYDITRNCYYWTKLKNIHIGKDYVGLLQITNGHDNSFRKGIWCTGEHRWIVTNSKVVGFAKAKELPRTYKTLLLPKTIFPEVPNSLLEEREAFLLGWYLTDGFLTGKKNLGLGINVTKTRSIDLLDKQLQNIAYSKNKYRIPKDKSHYITAYHISSKIFNPIYQIYKSNLPSLLVLGLSKQARESMLLAMLEGDGSMRRNKKQYDRFGALKTQKKTTCEIFELLCVSLGVPYTAREYKLPGSENIFIGYNLLKNDLTSNKNSNWKKEKLEEVWCPETECGTWVMRQGNQIVVTGNSQDPNLQNIPNRGELGAELRKAFIASKGKVLLAADYSQIELRIMAHLADDSGLKSAFQENIDIHALTASRIFKIPVASISKDQRNVGKTMNFATLYGQGPRALSRQLNVDFMTAKGYIEEYFQQFPKVRQWMAKVLEEGYKCGYVETIWGRRRYIPELQSSNRMFKAAGERAAVNHPVQGTSADMIKKAMIEIDRALHGQDCQMILQVHDELVFECDPKSLEETAKMVKDKMEQALGLSVPVKAEVKSGKNWGEMQKIDI